MKVICFGDSNTYGYDPRSYFGGRYDAHNRWVDILAEQTGWTVCNQGENGRGVPRTPVPFPADTDLLILMLGSNDLLQGWRPEAVADLLERFLTSLSLPRDKLLLIAPPPIVPGAWVAGQEQIDDTIAYARCCRALASRLSIRFADAGAWGVTMAYDGVHFTEAGHRAFAAGLCASMRGW